MILQCDILSLQDKHSCFVGCDNV